MANKTLAGGDLISQEIYKVLENFCRQRRDGLKISNVGVRRYDGRIQVIPSGNKQGETSAKDLDRNIGKIVEVE